MTANLFLLALSMAALAGAFVLGFLAQWAIIRIAKGKESAHQFIREEF